MRLKMRCLAAAALISLLLPAAACSGRPTGPSDTAVPTDTSSTVRKYDPEIELSIASSVQEDPAGPFTDLDNPWNEAYRQELGIQIVPKWRVEAAEYEQKLDIQIAAGDIPDILTGLGRVRFDTLSRMGLLVDFTQALAAYASPMTLEILNSDGGYSLVSSAHEGKLNALPHVYDYNDNIALMWIRTDWLQRLGLSPPETASELHDLLRVFVMDDPDGNGQDDTYGLCMKNDLWEIGSVFNMFGAQPFWSWYKDGSTLKYATVAWPEKTKAALAYLADLYREGLIYPEFGLATSNQYVELFKTGKAGIAFEYKFFPDMVSKGIIQEQPSADWQAYPIPTGLPGNEPARPFSYHGPAAYNVMSNKSGHPEAAVKMLNLFVEKVFSKDMDKYYAQFVKDSEGNDILQYALYKMDRANDISIYDHVAAAVRKKDPSGLSLREKDKYDTCMRYLEGNRTLWADYKLYGPGNATISAVKIYMTDIRPLFSEDAIISLSQGQTLQILDAKWREVCTQIIMGSKPVSEYDQYIQQWYELGGDQIEITINETAAP